MRNVKFSRRTMLRGLGYGTLFCSGLVDNLYAQALPRITRVAMFGYANGSQYQSEPTGGEKNFVLKPHMAPLEAVRDDILVFKNLTLIRDPGNAHRSASFSVFGLGAPTSIDQEFARFLKDTTPLASLEMAVGQTSGDGGVIPGLSQVDGRFIPSVTNPLAAYQRIADRISGGAPTMNTPSAAEQALLRRQSVLDFIKDDVKSFRGRLGPEEAVKMDFYLESLRTLERDVGGSIPQESSCKQIASPLLSKNTMMNDMPEHSRLYLDILAMAFACNITRVASMMWGGGENNEAIKFGDIDISAWHSISHGDPDGAPGQQITRLQAYFAGEFRYFVEKLKSISDGEFSLLDNTAAVLCTQNGSSQLGSSQNFAATDHPPQHAPFVVAGSCGGAWKTGRLLDAGGRNHNDVYVSIARALGMNVTSVGRASWCRGPLIS
ncbi:hypothetical protein BE17_10500 [Sorangium cellulosum]|uniref:Uncharacterized protein n=1 Tax=Sorangium cellulosum TaxID=56 RepID=A0A150S9G0_SORCE|nr:hypothetical protein BE17_10500 [Sorangium cellulosum]